MTIINAQRNNPSAQIKDLGPNTAGEGGVEATANALVAISPPPKQTNIGEEVSFDEFLYLAAFNARALSVDGVDEYMTLADHGDFNFQYNDAFSLSAWVKTSSTGWRGIINKQITSSTAGPFTGWDMGTFNGKVVCILSSDWGGAHTAMGATATGTTIHDGEWHLVVCTFDGTALVTGTSIYIDGDSKTVSAQSYNALGTNTIQNTEPVRIGNMPVNGVGDAWWTGGIDEVSVWNKELSSTEVEEIYGYGSPQDLTDHSAVSDLISWWRMGDGDNGAGAYDSSDSTDGAARIYDMSDNGHNLTPVNTEAEDIVFDAP